MLGVHFVKWMGESGVAPEEWLDPWKDKTTTTKPQIVVDEYAAPVVGDRESHDGRLLPIYDRQRYRVTCRPRCGRRGEVVTVERLEDPKSFDALARPELTVAPGERVALFLDCSKSEDATGLVGCRLTDGHVFVLGVWQRPHGDRGKGWLAPREEVDATVREACDRLEVAWFGVDPSPARDDADEALYWAPLIDQWHRAYRDRLPVWATPGVQGHAVKYDLRLSQRGGVDRNRAFTEAAMATAAAIDSDRSLTWDGSPALRLHVHNARRRPNAWGVSLGKANRDSRKLVDLAVCMVGARLGRDLALNSGKLLEKKKPSPLFAF